MQVVIANGPILNCLSTTLNKLQRIRLPSVLNSTKLCKYKNIKHIHKKTSIFYMVVQFGVTLTDYLQENKMLRKFDVVCTVHHLTICI